MPEDERRPAASDATRGFESSHAKVLSEDAARRLARAIYSDVALYEVDKVAGRAPERVREILRAELAEAREVFDSRVSEQLRAVFDEEFTYLLRAVSHRLRIDSDESARFFARSLLQPARREAAVAAGSRAIDEARQFYRSRVPERLYAVFDALAAEPGLEP